jgi:general secretion pathway protein D
MILRLARLWLVPGLLASAVGLQAQVPPSATTHPAPPILAPLAPPAPAKPKNDDMVDSFKVADLDIDAVLGALETFTGKTIVRPGTLPTATYSLRINRPISKAELVIALETILELNNVSVSPMGDRFLKVTPLSQAKSEAPEMILGSSLDLPPSGKIVSKIFELTFLRTSEFVPQIQSFMTPGIAGGLVQLEKANVVLVTDTLENVQRVERLLLDVDHPREGSLVPKFYTLHNGAKAADVVAKIHSMISGPAANSLRATTSFTADDRTNQIIVIADAREYPLFDSLIEQLDIKSDPYTRMEVIPLKHGDAKDVATLLSSLITGQTSAAKASQSVRPNQIVTPGQPAPAAPGAAPAPATSQPNSEGPASSEFSSFITVQPDERTNSVVVSGTFDDIKLIKGIVDKIDVLLAQVSIQVVIAEVSLSDTDQNGIQALNLTVGPAANGGTSITNFSGSIAGWNVTSGIVNPLSFVAALQSAGDKHKVKILQQDTITTTHNKQASFVVSEQLPIITGTTGVPLASGTVGGSFATSSTVTYQDIGITLKVTPLIGDDGSVQLQIDQKVDSNEGSVTIDGNAQPIIGHREATSFINVMDGQMAVLGGLQSSGLTSDKTKLGLLYELPIISNLFGARTRDLERTELLLFIRPHVLRPDEATGDTKRQIEGMSNSGQIKEYLKDTSKMPNPKETLKDKLD